MQHHESRSHNPFIFLTLCPQALIVHQTQQCAQAHPTISLWLPTMAEAAHNAPSPSLLRDRWQYTFTRQQSPSNGTKGMQAICSAGRCLRPVCARLLNRSKRRVMRGVSRGTTFPAT